jgi:hypothetical protein
MDFKEAAVKILKRSGKPLSAKEITYYALQDGILETSGKTPEATMAARIYTDINKNGNQSRFVKVKRGVFSLRESFCEEPKKMDNKTGDTDSLLILIHALRDKQFKSDTPSDFEAVLRDAFDSLGFEAELIGGCGDTDVLLTANVGKESFKVNIDGKTSRSGKIIDRQIDWLSLQDHKKKNRTDFVVVVGPDFSGGNLETRALDYGVSLLKTEDLVKLLQAHSKFPFTLLELRDLFSGKGDCNQQISDLLNQNHSRRVLLEQFRIIIEEMQSLQDRLGYFTFDSLAGREKMEELEVSPEDIDYIIKLLCLPFVNGIKEIDQNKFVLTIRKKEMANIFREFSYLLEDNSSPDEVILSASDLPSANDIAQPIVKQRKTGSRYFEWQIRGTSVVASARKENPYDHHCPIQHFKTILNIIIKCFNDHNVVNADMISTELTGLELAPGRLFKGNPEVYKIRMTLGVLEIDDILTWTGSKRPIEYKLNVSKNEFLQWIKSNLQ